MALPNFGFGIMEAELWRLIFVMVRIGAALLAAPLFGAGSVPVQVRIAMAGAISVFVLVHTPIALPQDLLSFPTLLSLLSEAVMGFAFGFILQLTFAAPVLAAEQISGAMGMAIATAVDPNTGGQSGALGQYFTVVITLVFLSLGGHLLWLRLLIESYRVFPPGAQWFGADRAYLVAGFAGQMLITAVTIALPVTLVLLLVQMATGVLSRSAPSLNLFSLGLPAGVLAGIAALISAMPLLTDQFIVLSLNGIAQTEAMLMP
ncbi:flagellar biosynthetic protein FliR [Croceicoccus sp. F390]|uniref:Flagellar biosynthetic protein FliR n=1 Tax=Croceicoccus esteveae TaxID=3075597 RepID=A0ABU2ZGE1_9SPHN|nr:flagellar biosynthetic protein FliR [Croceicoccus sp. F390]MDT0574679.1 flagellar biosynthetic protein FliR [Croceicoccus sp. F390]